MEKEWCREHITERNNWFVTQSGKKIEIQSDWKFCPVCGAPRPSEPKKEYYWQELKERWARRGYKSLPSDEVFQEMANLVPSEDFIKTMPEPKKGLVEKLSIVFHQDFQYLTKSPYQERGELLAKEAISHVLGVVESIDSFPSGHQYFKSELIKKLKEEGEG